MVIDSLKYPHTAKGIQYAKDVISGKIVSCIYVLNACQRFFKDIETSKLAVSKFYFDFDKSEKFLRLGQKFNHVKGEWKTPNVVFEPWQCFIFMNIYGFVSRETGSRRFRSSHIEVARGNGKSAIASIVGLFHLCLDDMVKGNEIYSAATGKEQAKIILDSSRAMAMANPSFLKKKKVKVLKHKITHDKTNSVFKALSSDSKSLDGLQPACALIDELHSHKTREVYDVIDSAMSKRKDSLMFSITTAGFKITGIGYSQSQYAKKVCTGAIQDDAFFAIVFTLDEQDDPFNPDVWIKSNPNWGISVDPINFANKAQKAQTNPEDKNNFMVKHLDIWSAAANPFFDVKKWDACKKEGLRIEDFYGEKCFGAIDLASKIDLVGKAFVFKPDDFYRIFFKAYIPEERLKDSRNKTAYSLWVEKGWLNVMPGPVINYMRLQDELEEISKKILIESFYYDPWNAREFSQRMIEKDINMVEFSMNTSNLSEPTKKFDALIREEKIFHDGNPMVSWCIGNVVAKKDAKDNVFPKKEIEDNKIDPAIAGIMALAGYVQYENEDQSAYDRQDKIIL